MRSGYYVGLVESGRFGLTNFVFGQLERPRDISGILRRNPEFALRVREIYVVDVAEWDGRIQEPERAT